MKTRHTVRTFLTAALATFFLTNLIPSALASGGKMISVFPGVKIYIDDVELEPKDVNGNSVEAFIYNGTTYLPVRAVSEALGKPVQWDGNTGSVYIGSHNGQIPAAWLSEMDYFSGDKSISTAASEKDNLGETHSHCITKSFERTYMLNGQYSRISGVLYQTYEYRYDYLKGYRTYTNNGSEPYDPGIWIYGDGELLYSHSFSGGETGVKPVNFDVNLRGVLELRVVMHHGGSDSHGDSPVLSLGDVGLWS